MPTDADLLHRYVQGHDEKAFAELVERHLNVVYAAALRRTGGRRHLAEEISQKVFADLARKAVRLQLHPAIIGWLYRSTRYAAIDVMRAESRRQQVSQVIASTPDFLPISEPTIDWEQLRPVLDAAMDELKETDRQLMLLRFFNGFTFADAGARLSLSEDAARRRTERALDKLRTQLARRGVTSTTTALGLLLANQPLVAAPAGLAVSVTTTALATVPAGAFAILLTTFLMNKIVITTLSAALAAALTTVVWATLADKNSNQELATLQAENTRLTQATAVGASGVSVAAVADEYSAQVTTIVRTVAQRVVERNAAVPSKFRNRGQATPHDAFLTLAWARDTSDSAALAKILTYDEKGREDIRVLYTEQPATIRAQFPTPEEFVVFLFVADILLRPLPGADMAEKFVATETGPGQAVVGPPGAPLQNGLHWVRADEGWKYVVPEGLPAWLAKGILGNEMLTKLGVK